MNDNSRKISKAKGVQICADSLYEGKARKDILPILVETYGISVSTVEKWLKAARVIVDSRNSEDEVIRRRETEAGIVEAAKRLNITKERILEEYAKIGYFDIRKLYNEDGSLKKIVDLDEETAGGLAGVESIDEFDLDGIKTGTSRKVRSSDKKAALDSMCKLLGYFPTGSIEIPKEGAVTVTLNLG